jgi:ribonuclease HI
MTAIPKGTATARIKAEMEQTIEEEGLENYARVYTDGSLMEDRVGCAIICEAREIKIRLPKQMSIFNAEAVVILEAIKATKRWGLAKRIILSDSLSNLMAQQKIYTRGNSKISELKDLLAEERANLKIMWIPAHVGIGGNECADRAAKDALEQKETTGHKVGKLDY